MLCSPLSHGLITTILDVVEQVGLGSGGEAHSTEFRNRGAFKRLIRRPARHTVNRRELWVPSIAKIVESFLFSSRDSWSDVTSFQFPADGIMRMSIREPVRCDVPTA